MTSKISLYTNKRVESFKMTYSSQRNVSFSSYYNFRSSSTTSLITKKREEGNDYYNKVLKYERRKKCSLNLYIFSQRCFDNENDLNFTKRMNEH
jgi:hypothetical protein